MKPILLITILSAVMTATVCAALSNAEIKVIVIDESSPELKDKPSRHWVTVFSSDAKTLAVTAGWHNPREAGELILWDLPSQKVRLVRRQDVTIRAAAFSPDGKLIAIGDWAGVPKLLDAATGQLMVEFPKHEGFVNSVAFTPDGKTLVSAAFDGVIKLLDVATRQEMHAFKLEQEMVNSVSISADGTRLAASTRSGNVHVWNLTSREKLYSIEVAPKAIVEVVAFAPDGKTFATGDWRSQVQLWDSETGKRVREFPKRPGLINNLAFSPDGATLAVINSGGLVVVWDLATGKEAGSWRAHGPGAMGLSFSPDGKQLATTSHARDPKLWDANTGKLITSLER